MTRFKLSDLQAQAILDMQLRRLAALERKKIEDELAEVKKTIKFLEALLKSPKKILGVISEELTDLKKRFGDARRTHISDGGDETRFQSGRFGAGPATARFDHTTRLHKSRAAEFGAPLGNRVEECADARRRCRAVLVAGEHARHAFDFHKQGQGVSSARASSAGCGAHAERFAAE